MPELPEVQTVVSELNRKLKNKKIKEVTVSTPKIISLGPQTVSNIRQPSGSKVKQFIVLLSGQKILSVKRRAKLLIFDLSGPLAMLVHLKMTGQFIYEDKKLRLKSKGKYRILNKLTAPLTQLPSKYTHVIFKFTDGSALYYNDLRQFGYLKLVKDDEINSVKELQAYGPEPLSKKFTHEAFAKIVEKVTKRQKLTAKQFLTDQSLIAGIGNIYSDEILFDSKIQPIRLMNTLDKKELKALYKATPKILKIGIKYKGSSVGDYVRTDGSWGTMGKHHFVYGRSKQPCKVCGTIIQSIKLGGRTSSYCSRCQK